MLSRLQLAWARLLRYVINSYREELEAARQVAICQHFEHKFSMESYGPEAEPEPEGQQ